MPQDLLLGRRNLIGRRDGRHGSLGFADGVHEGDRVQSSPVLGVLIVTNIIPHRSASFIITSNRAMEECLSLFYDPILGNTALDSLANASFQIVIEGTSYREKLSPHQKILAGKGAN